MPYTEKTDQGPVLSRRIRLKARPRALSCRMGNAKRAIFGAIAAARKLYGDRARKRHKTNFARGKNSVHEETKEQQKTGAGTHHSLR